MTGTIKDQLKSDLTQAMKGRDEVRSATIRMALTAITNEEVSGKTAKELTDAELITVLTREAKKRRESATAYRDANRTDLADRELAELAVLETYLPSQLSDEELNQLVAQAIAELGASGPQAMGQVMKALQPKIAGRVDGGRLATEVKTQLNN